MKRSHRLLRTVHRLRKNRLPFAAARSFYEPYAELAAFDVLLRDLHGYGYLDRDVMFEPTLALVELLTARLREERAPGGLFGRVGRAMARVAFARRLTADGRYRIGGSERYVAEGCGTLAEAAVLDRVVRAMGEVMRQRALIDHREDPCWPESYRIRFAEAEDRRLGLLADDGGSEAPEGAGGALTGPVERLGGVADDDDSDLDALAEMADDDDAVDEAEDAAEDGGEADGVGASERADVEAAVA